MGVERRPSAGAAQQRDHPHQPVTRFLTPSGRAFFIDTPQTLPIIATETVGFGSAGDDAPFTALTSRTPSGWNRITVCADTSDAVAELSRPVAALPRARPRRRCPARPPAGPAVRRSESFGDGCRCNQNTLDLVRDGGL